MSEQRVYPTACTAMYCERRTCDGCPNLPTLREFESWRERTAAVQPDPIRARTIWVATKAVQP